MKEYTLIVIKGNIVHSRSSANQYFNFHYMYGGFKKYAWDRWFMGHWYRRNLRNWWLPVVVCYSGMINLIY
jgi:hypothetical protein